MTAAGCLEHIWLKDECNIDRHIFNAIKTKQQLEQDGDEDDDNDDHNQHEDGDHVNGQNNHEQEDEEELPIDANDEIQIVKDKPQAINVDSTEQETNSLHNSYSKINHKTANSHVNGHTTAFANGHSNGHTSALSNGHYTNGFLNGHSSASTNGHLSNNFKKLRDDLPHEKSIKLSSIKQANPITTKTTIVHSVPATKAVTVPLCSVQPTSSMQHKQQAPLQQQQMFHIPARRHSSDSNKENTFLATKKITANNCNINMANLKKSSSSCSPTTAVTQSATATIHVTSSASLSTANIVTTITLPSTTTNAISVANDKVPLSNGTHHSLFPDAPTTPKVIRKTPTTDASPTSVKALVKKFQLEGGEQATTPPEFATTGSRAQQQQQQQQQMQLAQQTHPPSQLKYHANGVRSSMSPPTLAHSSAITIANSARRASEPITAIHTSKKQNTASSSAPVAIPASAAQSYKTLCVYCVSCTNSSTNGCRHPNSTATKNSCSTNPLSGSSTKCLINGSTSNGSLTSTTSSSIAGASSSTTTALLFSQHQHMQSQHLLNSHQQPHQQQHSLHHPHSHHLHPPHHHLHHHGVVKNAAASANGLSLDQGIIC